MQNLPHLCQGVQTMTKPNFVRGRIFLKETETQYTVQVPFPGFPKESINLLLYGDFLKINAATTPVKNELDPNASDHEPLTGSAVVQVPERVNKDLITATHADGLLTITLPKIEARQIAIL